MEFKEDIKENITLDEVLDIYESIELISEPQIPFPQLNVFNDLLDLCERLYVDGSLSSREIKEIFGFKPRQYSYCKGAGEYLGLIEKRTSGKFYLTSKGLDLFSLNDKERNLELIKLILQHKPFYDCFSLYMSKGEFPNSNDIFLILKNSNLYNLNSDVTIKRRSSTVKGWINWIIDLISLC